jgi:hypothetical protein
VEMLKELCPWKQATEQIVFNDKVASSDGVLFRESLQHTLT